MFDLLWNIAGLQFPGDRFSDSFIEAGVKDALKSDPDLRGERFEIAVENGVVTLRGTARDAMTRERAEATAASAPGVRQVVNRIVVPGEPA